MVQYRVLGVASSLLPWFRRITRPFPTPYMTIRMDVTRDTLGWQEEHACVCLKYFCPTLSILAS